MKLMALTRDVSPTIDRCELTYRDREPIDVAAAGRQHEAYRARLRALDVEVASLPALPEHPDAVFVEDTAVVLDELAVIARPGASSRRGECPSVGQALAGHRPLVHIREPATLDGGDVCVVGRTLFVGRSGRTNEEGIAQLSNLVAQFGYAVRAVPVSGCLHLKSAMCALGPELVLGNRDWFDPSALDARVEVLDVSPDEPGSANVIAIGADVVMSAAHPRTAELLVARGCRVHPVDNSELLKAEAGVSCCSLIFSRNDGWGAGS